MKSSCGFTFFFTLSNSDLMLVLSEFVIFSFLRYVQPLLFEGYLFMSNSLFYSALSTLIFFGNPFKIILERYYTCMLSIYSGAFKASLCQFI